MYALFNVGAWIFVWKYLPELTGRSLEQIERRLRDGKFRPADFDRVPADQGAPATNAEAPGTRA